MWDVMGFVGIVALVGVVFYFLSRLIGSEQARDRSREYRDDSGSGSEMMY